MLCVPHAPRARAAETATVESEGDARGAASYFPPPRRTQMSQPPSPEQFRDAMTVVPTAVTDRPQAPVTGPPGHRQRGRLAFPRAAADARLPRAQLAHARKTRRPQGNHRVVRPTTPRVAVASASRVRTCTRAGITRASASSS